MAELKMYTQEVNFQTLYWNFIDRRNPRTQKWDSQPSEGIYRRETEGQGTLRRARKPNECS